MKKKPNTRRPGRVLTLLWAAFLILGAIGSASCSSGHANGNGEVKSPPKINAKRGAPADIDQTLLKAREGIKSNRPKELKAIVAMLDKVIKDYPNHTESYHLRGIAKMRAGDFFGATRDMKAAADSVDVSAPGGKALAGDIYFNMGNVLQVHGFIERATLAYSTALTYRPDDPEIMGNLITAYLWQKRFGEAQTLLTKLKTLRPNDPQVYTNEGLLHQFMKDRPQAEQAYRKAVSLDANFCVAHFNLARLYEFKKSWNDAAASYEEYLRCRPTAPDFHPIKKHVQGLRKRHLNPSSSIAPAATTQASRQTP